MTTTSLRTPSTRTVRRGRLIGLAIATTGALVPIAVAPPASAHATVLSIAPSDGQRLTTSKARTTVSVALDEVVTVTPSSLRVRDAEGRILTGATIRTIVPGDEEDRSTISARTRRALPAGRYALEYSLLSSDGHPLRQAFGFAVGKGTPRAKPARIRLAASASGSAPRTVISGARVGARSVQVDLPAGVTGGSVQLTCQRSGGRAARVSAPFIWTLSVSGGRGVARGYLPTPCTYSVSITLERPFPADPTTWRTSKGLAISR